MAIETHQDRVEAAGSGPPLGGPGGVLRPWWLRPGVHVGMLGAVIGYILGHLLGNFLSSAYQQNALSDSNDIPIVLGYAFGTIGWLAGLGVFNDLGRQMLGKPLLAEVRRGAGETGLSKYFRYTLDHKVVGIQYLFGMIAYFLTGGLFAMAIRSELLSPTAFQFWASGVQSKEQRDGVLAALPPYALTYDPTVVPQLGKNLPKIDGITGAAGYYYPPSDPVTP